MAAWEDMLLLSTLGQRPPLGYPTKPPLGRFTALAARAADPAADSLAAYLVGFPIPPLDEAENQSLLPFTSPGDVESPAWVQARAPSSLPPAEIPTPSSESTPPGIPMGDGEQNPGQKADTEAPRFPIQRPDLPSQAAQLPDNNELVRQKAPIQRNAGGQPPATAEDSIETSAMVAAEGQGMVEAPEFLPAESQDEVQAEAVIPDAIAEKLPRIPLSVLQRQPLSRTQPLGKVGNTAAKITQQLRQKHREAMDSEAVLAYDTASAPDFALPGASEQPTQPTSEEAASPDLRPGVGDAEGASLARLDQTPPSLPRPDQAQGSAAESTEHRVSESPQTDTALTQPRVLHADSEPTAPAPSLVGDSQASLAPIKSPDIQNSLNQENLDHQTVPLVEEVAPSAAFSNLPSVPVPIIDRPASSLLDPPHEDVAPPTDKNPASPSPDAPLRARPALANSQQTSPAAELSPPVTDSPLNADRSESESDQMGGAAAIAPAAASSSLDAIPSDWRSGVLDPATPPSPETNALSPVQRVDLGDRPSTAPDHPQPPTAIPQPPPAQDDPQPQKELPAQLAVNPRVESIQPTPEAEQFSTVPAAPSPPVSNPEPSAPVHTIQPSAIQRRGVKSSTSAWENQFDLDTALPSQSIFQDFSVADTSIPTEMPEAETESLLDGSEPSADPEAEEAAEATSIAADHQTSDQAAMLNSLAEWIYADLRSHLHRSQAHHSGLHPSLPMGPPPFPYGKGHSQGTVDLHSLPPPQLLQLTTIVHQQVESRLRQDIERQPTPYLARL